jgi:nitrate/nitrite transporter NarK
MTGAAGSQARALVLATISFTLVVRGVGSRRRTRLVLYRPLRLTASETALLVAVPVLLGSLARLPMGMLTIDSADASSSRRSSPSRRWRPSSFR